MTQSNQKAAEANMDIARFGVLGTDGYGLSESRHVLRDHFEVSTGWIAYTALVLASDQQRALAIADEFGLDRGKLDPSR